MFASSVCPLARDGVPTIGHGASRAVELSVDIDDPDAASRVDRVRIEARRPDLHRSASNWHDGAARVAGRISRHGTGLPDLLLVLAISAGVAARLAAGFYHHSQTIFDFLSYELVAGIVTSGHSVYASTWRYNYGPVWFLVLDALWRIAHSNVAAFAWLIRLLLTAADAAIAWLVARSVGRFAAVVFILNPVSILVTGVQLQFDNLAILIALGACVLVQARRLEQSDSLGALLVPALLLGCSLVVKHDCLFFPFWIAFRRRFGWRQLAALVLPFALFVLSFVPYASAWRGIVRNVAGFRPGLDAPLGHLVGAVVDNFRLMSVVFAAAVLGVGWLCRRMPLPHALAAYLVTIVALSPRIDLEYFAIPALAVAVLPNAAFAAYTVLVTLWFLSSGQLALHLDLGWSWLTQFVADGAHGLLQAACVLLAAGLSWRVLGGRRSELSAALGRRLDLRRQPAGGEPA
jgi:hypothetical protein